MRTNRQERKNKAIAFLKLLLFTVLLFFVAACSQNNPQKPTAEPERKLLPPPKITLLSQLAEKDKPKIILLDTAPKPPVINLPARDRITRPGIETGISKKHLSINDTSNTVIINETEGIGFFESLTTDNGLCLDQVYCSYKDTWGNLWFGTTGGGVSRYDGKTFTNYSTTHGLANNGVWCIIQDHNGNIWFGTDGSGVSKYDGESFTNYSTVQGLPDNVVFSIIEDKERNLWFGTLKGISKWDGKSFTNYSTKEGLSNNAVKTMLQDRKGNLWFGTLDGGVSKWDGKTFVNYTTKEGLIGNRVMGIEEDNSGNLWFGTEGKGLSKWDGNVFTNYPLFNEASADAVLCIKKDKQGSLWLGTQKSGVIKYDGRTFTRYSTANGLANNHIRSITEDEKGNLWFGSFGSGVSKFSGNGFKNFTTFQGLVSNVVFSIEEDKEGKLWLGTSDGGVSHYDGKLFEAFTKTDGLPRNKIYSVLQDRAGHLWFGTSVGGVSKFNGKTFTNYTMLQGLANNIVFSIAEDKAGNLWFGTSGGGVSKFDGKSFTNYTTLQGLAGNVVFSIKEDKHGNLWFGTLGDGVSKFDGKSFTNYTVKQGLSDNVVWTVTEDNQANLWFGTQNGLSLMASSNKTDASPQKSLFTSFTTADGLPDNFITQVVQGDGEKLYIGTNLGMCELVPVKDQNSSGKNWIVGKTFNTQHGYPVKDVNAGLNAMFKDSKGVIWIGTGSDKTGLVRFEPTALSNDSSKAPKLFINQIKINNEAVSWRDIDASDKENTDSAKILATITEEITTYGKKLTELERDSFRNRFAGIKFNGINKWQPLPQKLILPFYFNNISFDFGAIETSQNFLVNYKYFLEGYDKEWSPPSHSTSANFGNISEGHYTFQVKAQSPEGVWGETVSYSFTVLPPLWRTWWMLAVYGILILSAILLFIRWKHKRIIYQKKILEHKVAVATKQVREETKKVQVQKKKVEDTLNELKSTQAQLIQSEKMASLGELTAGIAHEIQNPLNFVNNFSEVNKELLAEMNDEMNKGNYDEVKAIAKDIVGNEEKINQHGKRADAIVKGMLQHSRAGSGQKQPTDINALADEYVRMIYNGLRTKDKDFNAEIKTSFDKTIEKINIVPQDIGKVLLNVISNAFYAVSERQKTQGESYKPLISIQTQKLNNNVEIRVTDNGNGIPQNIIDKIFQPFFTTKPTGQGTGLGLSLAYDIITKEHNGSLQAESKEGEGSVFIAMLPLNYKG